MIKINCDIGERGPDNAVDIELMSYIHIANIACGGHAGDEESIGVFRELAAKNDIEVAGHLSYPDKENFGRVSMDIPSDRLVASLDEQYRSIPDVGTIKFHGALYNDASADRSLSEILVDWLHRNRIVRIITPDKSELAICCAELEIEVVAEAFAERRYAYSTETGRLSLVSRAREYACIEDCDEAVKNTVNIVDNQQVEAVIEHQGAIASRRTVPIKADTVCIHSDSAISLELARKLSSLYDKTVSV
ncbi:MAG: hypothetical protein GY866_16215 [Proteobacteria bacterium]|nr:hypothetical protein [Pseudomonadota bacterium]